MSLRAVGSLLARRFLPGTVAAGGSSLRFSINPAIIVLGASALAGGGTLAVQYFKDGRDAAESAARRKEEDMKARFEDWVKEQNRTYPDEEEKARRFQVFKANCEFMDSHNLSVHKRVFPEMSCFADMTREELSRMKKAGICNVPGESEHNTEMWGRFETGQSLLSTLKKAGYVPVEQGRQGVSG